MPVVTHLDLTIELLVSWVVLSCSPSGTDCCLEQKELRRTWEHHCDAELLAEEAFAGQQLPHKLMFDDMQQW